MDDHGRLDDDRAVVYQRRHHAVGIDLQILRREMIAVQLKQVALPLKPLFRESEPHLLRAHRSRAVIKLEHDPSIHRITKRGMNLRYADNENHGDPEK